MKKILTHRYPLAKMILIPTLVQGSGSKEDIVLEADIETAAEGQLRLEQELQKLKEDQQG